MDVLDDIKLAKEIVNALLKARKMFRMYPESNPMYARILDDTYGKFKEYLDFKESFTLKIKQNELYCDSEQVYSSSLFLFKDGLREITFKKDFSRGELEDFLRIITVDYERMLLDDDVVTMLWEKDLPNIKYVVDETFLADDEENYEAKATTEIKEKTASFDEISRAYSDSFSEEGAKEITIVPLTDKDLQVLVKEIEADSNENKIKKLILIIFEILYQAETKSDYEDAVYFLKGAIEFSLRHGDLESAVNIMKKISEFTEGSSIPDTMKKYLTLVTTFASSESAIKLLGEFLDSGVDIDENIANEYAKFLDKNAIQPFISILGDLKTIPGRKTAINALVILGSKDIPAIAKGLYDTRWYVVRNVIFILGKIGDKRAADYLVKNVNHSDVRVRKEVVKALGDIGSQNVLLTLKQCLEDSDVQIRTSAARSIGSVASIAAKNIILQAVSNKSFMGKDFNEKKEFYEVLSRWKEKDVIEFLLKALAKKSFFRRKLNDENRACVSYALGIMGSREGLPILKELANSKNLQLREHAGNAVKRIEYGK
jgi:HEAT repeat protein